MVTLPFVAEQQLTSYKVTEGVLSSGTLMMNARCTLG
jgi:hypothetical protein